MSPECPPWECPRGPQPGPLAPGGVHSATLATLRPLAAGSARRKFFPSAGHSSNRTTDNLQECPPASSTPPHRLGSPDSQRTSHAAPSRCVPSTGAPSPEPQGERVREEGQAQTRGFTASRATKRGPPSEDAEAGHNAPYRGTIGGAHAGGGPERSFPGGRASADSPGHREARE